MTRLQEHRAYLQYTEGCFGDKLHSLQARRLWSPLRTVSDVLETANLWLLLLEKKVGGAAGRKPSPGAVRRVTLAGSRFLSRPSQITCTMALRS